MSALADPAVHSAIERALEGLRYGTVQLTVHDGKLVRIERMEKIRLEEPTGTPGGKTQYNG